MFKKTLLITSTILALSVSSMSQANVWVLPRANPNNAWEMVGTNPPPDPVTALYLDPQTNNIFAASDGIIFKATFDPSNQQYTWKPLSAAGLPGGRILNIVSNSTGDVFASTIVGAVYYLVLGTSQWQLAGSEPPENIPVGGLIIKQDTLFATDGNQVVSLSRPYVRGQWGLVGTGLPSGVGIYVLSFDNQGNLFAAGQADESLQSAFELQLSTRSTTWKPLPLLLDPIVPNYGENILAIALDKNDNLFASGADGVYELPGPAPYTNSKWQTLASRREDQIFGNNYLQLDAQGHPYVGGNEPNGLAGYDVGGQQGWWQFPDFNEETITGLQLDSFGDLFASGE